MLRDGADRALDQRRAVVERDDPNAARQAGLKLADLGLDAARDLERVFAVGHQDHAAGDLVAVLLEDAAAEAGAERDVGDLGEPDRAAIRRAARPRFPGRGRRDRRRSVSSPGVGDAPSRPTPRTTYSAFPLWTTCPPDAAFDVATASTTSSSDTPKSPQPVGVGDDLVLDRESADARDLGHARDRAELGADVPVLDRAQPAQIEARALDGVPEDLAGRRGVGRQLGAARRRAAGLRSRASRSATRRRPSARSTSSSKITLIIEKPTSLDDRTTRTPRSPRRPSVSG